MPRQIAVINRKSVYTDDQAKALTAALQIQVTRDFWTSSWSIDADLHFVGQGAAPRSGSEWLGLLDTSDQAGALGYHDMTAEGQPMGKVFLKTTIQDGGLPSVTASHELLECSWTPGSISPSRSRPPTRPARSMPWRFAMCARPMIIRTRSTASRSAIS